MELILFFMKVLTLNFTVTFIDNSEKYQNYLILHGEDCSLHLFRDLSNISLVLSNEDNITSYYVPAVGHLNFTVPGLILNNDKISEINFECQYDSFMFIDPIFPEKLQSERKSANQDVLMSLVGGTLFIFIVAAGAVIGYNPDITRESRV